MVLEAVRGCTDCTQLAWSRRCCERCSEQLMGIMNPVPLMLPARPMWMVDGQLAPQVVEATGASGGLAGDMRHET